MLAIKKDITNHFTYPEHPENIVEKQSREETCADLVGADADLLQALHAEGNAQYIVQHVMLGVVVGVGEDNGHQQAELLRTSEREVHFSDEWEGLLEPVLLASADEARHEGREGRRERDHPCQRKVARQDHVHRVLVEVLKGIVESVERAGRHHGELHGICGRQRLLLVVWHRVRVQHAQRAVGAQHHDGGGGEHEVECHGNRHEVVGGPQPEDRDEGQVVEQGVLRVLPELGGGGSGGGHE